MSVNGLEDMLTNDLCCAMQWEEVASWKWKGQSHINLKETAAKLKLFRDVGLGGGDCRFVYAGDSHVARSALARGRTSSGAMRPLLKKSAVLCLAFGLYPAGRFTPTRLNPGDAPSRLEKIAQAVEGSLMRDASPAELVFLSSLASLKRWAANWCRLVLLLSPAVMRLKCDNGSTRTHALMPIKDHEWSMDFDSTLGYPGEGPLPCTMLFWIFLFLSFWFRMSAVKYVGSPSHGDELRRNARAGITLAEGRRVTQTTSMTREWLFANFEQWTVERGYDLTSLLFSSPVDVDGLNTVLTAYGRWLFAEGKPFYHYSETLNSVSAKRPVVRRSLQSSWDLAFIWGSFEPVTHHVAMPPQILVAVVAVALSWGWSREAALFSLAWGAMLRIGELFQALRKDLIFPCDVAGSIDFILLRIMEPKTRFRAARHQAGKMEQPDLMQIVWIGLGKLKPAEPLWPFSGATLRNRLSKILSRLGLPTKNGESPKPLSLASFRPGGATWLITQTESAELVRRRGPWISNKSMECYLQEVTYLTYLNEVDVKSRDLVLAAFTAFPSLLAAVINSHKCNIPEPIWFFLLSKGSASCGRLGVSGDQFEQL